MIEVYLAGRMSGKTVEEAMAWRREFTSFFAESKYVGIHNPCYLLSEVLEPKEVLNERAPDIHHYFDGPASYQRDLWMIDKSHVVVANLVGDDWMSIGTLFELGYAKKAGKLIVAIAGKNDYARKHLFIENACTLVENIDDAIVHVANIATGAYDMGVRR